MGSDEEVDYMSDAFLQSICGKEDIRPGLMNGHAQKYDHKIAVKKLKTDEQNRSRNPSQKEKEQLSRESGLSKPIDTQNVGFKMLQRLGFKPGSGLGKSGEGRVEPISMEVKTDRQGLGRKSSLEEVARMRAKFRREAREKQLDVDDYRSRKAQEAAEKRTFLALMNSQRVCWQLDTAECIEEPAESWFWPESKLPAYDDDDEEEEVEHEANTSSPCHDEENQRGDELQDEECDQEVEYNEEVGDDEEFSVEEKLEMLTLYLRRTYFYCVWCGHSFDDEKDLQQDCPGPNKEDH